MNWLNHLIPTDPIYQEWLSLLLHGVHTAMILFVLFGWIMPRFRRFHLGLLIVIWLSWLGLGLWVGHLGYCVLTDWHWRVLYVLGERDLPLSYIELMIGWVYDGDIDNALLRNSTAVTFIAITGLSGWLNLKLAVKRNN